MGLRGLQQLDQLACGHAEQPDLGRFELRGHAAGALAGGAGTAGLTGLTGLTGLAVLTGMAALAGLAVLTGMAALAGLAVLAGPAVRAVPTGFPSCGQEFHQVSSLARVAQSP
ncbi:hypothetical protein E3O49_02290 [Cryobacterium shii]|uniref:Uncharacterized protein n=1 Tax=Cryobacterium shii TaxID=1259235 RepID=A0AAQ2C8H8_9MICO|nr:hypothetical protein E3O49_02290 [Cryobacterium shii]